ncbi:MAG TPA: hypothetical protein PLM55_04655 [Chitinophagales bacterium]|nr:hypothetical protein [Chitinophagales bacterium]
MFWFNLLLLAAGAFSLTLNTLSVMGKPLAETWRIALFSGLLTVLAYLAMRSRLIFKHSNESAAKMPKSVALTSMFLVGAAVVGLSLFLLLNHRLGWQNEVVMVFTGVLTFLYFIPITLRKDGKRLRDIYWLKHFVVGANWSLATVAFPSGIYDLPHVLGLFLQVFFLIAALSLSFDLRDAALDTAEHHRSFYISEGETKLKALVLFLLSCCAVVLVIVNPNLHTTIIRLLLLVLSAFIILRAKPNDASSKFNVVLESIILLYGLAAWA